MYYLSIKKLVIQCPDWCVYHVELNIKVKIKGFINISKKCNACYASPLVNGVEDFQKDGLYEMYMKLMFQNKWVISFRY